MKKLISIVTNTYYAENFILGSLARIRTVAEEVRNKFNVDVEIIIVDDGSKDKTVEILTNEHKKTPDFTLATLTRNFGSMNSHRAGIEMAKGDAVIYLASDMQDPPETIPQLVAEWLGGFKFVYCPRTEREDPPISKAFAKTYYYLFAKLSHIQNFPKTGFDFCLMDRQVVDTFLSCKEKHYTFQQLVWWFGFKSVGIPIKREARAAGKSTWTFAKKFNLALDTFISMSYAPIRFMSFLGILVAFLSIGFGSYVLFNALFGNLPVAGWASIVCVISFLLGIVMMMLGIIGEYLWRILDQVRGRPSYVINEILK